MPTVANVSPETSPPKSRCLTRANQLLKFRTFSLIQLNVSMFSHAAQFTRMDEHIISNLTQH